MDTHIEQWFLEQRGIEAKTLAAWNVTQEKDMVVFPYRDGTKARKDPTIDGKRVFISTGSMPDLFFRLNESDAKVAFIVEGESDTLRLWQALRGLPEASQAHVYGLSGVDTWSPHFAEYLEPYDRVFVILDNDTDYQVKARADNCYKQIRLSIGNKARRITLPIGVKDICEFFSIYSIETLSELCQRKAVPSTKIKRLDLTKPPQPMDWLVDGLLCKGDVNLMIGAPGLGKSWLMMDLAVKIGSNPEEEGEAHFLGRTLFHYGKVLYIDEENPEDIIYHRFQKLGLSESGSKNIHYLYRPGIWLNKEPDLLIEEAMEIEPILIVLDSLSRIHSEDENNANAMARLFREGITPLARETGAAVVVIHHTVKGETNSSFQRSRGSGDITAVVDSAIDVRGTDTPGQLLLSQFKSRRVLGGSLISVQIKDNDEGGVELVATNQALPF